MLENVQEQSKENSLQSQVNFMRSTNAEVSNYQTLDGLVAVERARAMTKENSLQSQVNFIIHNVDPVAMDSLSEIVSKLIAREVICMLEYYLEQVVSTLRGESLYATVQPVYVPGVLPSAP